MKEAPWRENKVPNGERSVVPMRMKVCVCVYLVMIRKKEQCSQYKALQISIAEVIKVSICQ